MRGGGGAERERIGGGTGSPLILYLSSLSTESSAVPLSLSPAQNLNIITSVL